MPLVDRYIGVEQEFVSFAQIGSKREIVDFNEHFGRVRELEKGYFSKSNIAIRTQSGHAIYVDGEELEVVTPPVRINKGFSSRLTDLVMIGRNKISNVAPEFTHTGLSMHWNLSLESSKNLSDFYRGIAIPFHLFGLTPISTGLNLRHKVDNFYELSRAELLGDFLSEENQINALALMLGAYACAFEKSNNQIPIFPSNKSFEVHERQDLFVKDGRYSRIKATIPELIVQEEIQVQQYLEMFHRWISPIAKQLGTKSENSNLSDFIFGRKKLEFDQFNFFARVKDLEGKVKGVYWPIPIENTKMPYKTLKNDEKIRDLPLEGRLFGQILLGKTLKEMFWDSITFYDLTKKQGISNIYDYAAQLNKSLPHLSHTPSIQSLPNLKKIQLIEQVGPRQYTPESDSFKWPDFDTIGKTLKNFKELVLKRLYCSIAVPSIMLALGISGAYLYDYVRIGDEAVRILNEYSDQPKVNHTISNSVAGVLANGK